MARGLQRAMKDRQWKDGFIPHASTWLNQRRWEDDYDKGTEKTEVPVCSPRPYHIELIDGEEMVVYDE